MKNLLLLFVTIAAFATTSCRKERTCKCTTTSTAVRSTNNGPVTTVLTSSETTTKAKQYKGDFQLETDCYSRQYMETSDDGKTQTTFVVDCDLK